MKLKDCHIYKGLTIKLDRTNYHKVEIGMTAEFDETDDLEAGIEKLTALVNGKLAAEINSALEIAAQNGMAQSGIQPGQKQVLMEKQVLLEKQDA